LNVTTGENLYQGRVTHKADDESEVSMSEASYSQHREAAETYNDEEEGDRSEGGNDDYDHDHEHQTRRSSADSVGISFADAYPNADAGNFMNPRHKKEADRK
jgi:hypothetical protein